MALREGLRELYEGESARARWFQIALMTFDVVTIAYFLATATRTVDFDTRLLAVDLAIGAVLALDFAARWIVAGSARDYWLSLLTWADLVVLLSLLAPLIAGSNLGFLRVLRALRLMRTFRVAERLDKLAGNRVNERVLRAASNLAAFVFVVTSLVWVSEHGENPKVDTVLDALYFTMTTLTTTGFGDITLQGPAGRLLTIAIMVFGVGFFLKLLQALYQPDKVEVCCAQCGLNAHDRDASHCKHCGHVIYIETEGET